MKRIASILLLTACSSTPAENDGGLDAGTMDASITDTGGKDVAQIDSGVDAPADAPMEAGPPATPRLFAGNTAGKNPPTAVWNAADKITMDRPADAKLAVQPSTSICDAIAIIGKRAYVPGTGFLYAFDADTVGDGGQPVATVPSSGFGINMGYFNLFRARADAPIDSVWALAAHGATIYGVYLFKSASSLGNNAMYAARLESSAEYIDAARDTGGDRLFIGRVDGTIDVINSASSASGDMSVAFSLTAPGQVFALALDSTSLYVATASGGKAAVAIWRNLSSTSAPRAPDVVNTNFAGSSVDHITVANDTLVAGPYMQGVYVMKSASTITAQTMPSGMMNVSHDSFAYSTKTDRLYIGQFDRIGIWTNIQTTPSLVTSVLTDTSRPAALGLYEP
jgi:hypothetical protein